MLEVASESTADVDLNEKREDYAALGIGEYWRCDETGDYHGARLAGERLADGEYVAIDIEELPDESSQDIAGHWTCTCGGSRGSWRGTTRLRGGALPPLKMNAPVPTPPKPGSGSWKNRCAAQAHDEALI